MAKGKSTVTGVEKLIKKAGKISELNQSQATELARDVANEMKKLIARGVSPIAGNGRFPQYLAAGRVKEAKKKTQSFKTAGHSSKDAKQKTAKDTAEAKRGYPYSVQGKYPNKKPRPVNLFLSGKFLNDLQGRPKPSGNKVSAEVGIYGKESVLKEKGHREGANGQPLRPIIPNYRKGERFTDVIRLKIERYFKQLVKKNSS